MTDGINILPFIDLVLQPFHTTQKSVAVCQGIGDIAFAVDIVMMRPAHGQKTAAQIRSPPVTVTSIGTGTGHIRIIDIRTVIMKNIINAAGWSVQELILLAEIDNVMALGIGSAAAFIAENIREVAAGQITGRIS